MFQCDRIDDFPTFLNALDIQMSAIYRHHLVFYYYYFLCELIIINSSCNGERHRIRAAHIVKHSMMCPLMNEPMRFMR